MGPGARPVPQVDSSASIPPRNQPRNSRLQQVIAIRSSYSVVPTPSSVTINYTLNNRQRTFNLEYSALPLSGITSQLLYGSNARAATSGTFLIDTIRGVENVTGTQLTQQQAEGFALHASKRMLYGYSGIGSAIGMAMFFWQKGRLNMKFPFIKVRDPSRYQNFPNRYIPILKGNYARIMWQITRFNVYLTLGIFGLSPLFNSIGDTSMTVGLYRDDRTRGVLESMKQTVDSKGLQRIGGNLPSAAGPQSDQQGPAEYAPEDGFSNSTYGGDNDVSFTDGMNSTGDVPESVQPSASQMPRRAPPQQQQRSPRWGQRPTQQSSQQDTSYPESAQGGDPFEFNEDPLTAAASDPNSPQYDPAAAQRQQQQRPQRSWASIRNEARRGNTPAEDPAYASATPGPNTGVRSSATQGQGEQFSYRTEDANKQYAKEQAQKDFDAMLDRERQLGEQDNNTQSGGGWKRRGS